MFGINEILNKIKKINLDVNIYIAKELKNYFSLVQLDSVTKRIKRFLSNELFKPREFSNHVVKHTISNY